MEIDDQLERRGLFDGKISGLDALEDLVREPGRAAVHLRVVHPVGDQAAMELRRGIDRGQPTPRRQIYDERLVRLSEGLDSHDQRVGALADGGIERWLQILTLPHIEKLRL